MAISQTTKQYVNEKVTVFMNVRWATLTETDQRILQSNARQNKPGKMAGTAADDVLEREANDNILWKILTDPWREFLS